MLSRRRFIKVIISAGAGAFLVGRVPVEMAEAGVLEPPRKLRLAAPLSAIPGGTLDPLHIPKYQTALLIPPVMPMAARLNQRGGKPIDYYEISVRQFKQQILPAGLPATTVWGYGTTSSLDKRGLRIHNAPSLTIEARVNRPVRVKWINELVDSNGNYLPHLLPVDPLVDSNGNYLPHLLPVDPTLHWANPPGGTSGRDTRPTFEETPGPYSGPVPTVSHVHGAVGVGDESDGYPEAWFLPAAKNIPAGYATEGTWYNYFAGKANAKYGATWGPGYATFQYPNENRAATIWYHDHTLGMTRLNVYAGPAGFYIIRGGPAGDDAVLDTRTGTPAVFPGPAPIEGDKFPPNKTYREIPIAIQDRSFNADGSLFYPDSREFFDAATEDVPGFIPETDLAPIWNPEFFGNCIMVNGNTWPYLDVQRRRYRFRFLNGCQSRFLILDFSAIPGVEVWQIGNEGGLLAAPVNLTASNGNQLLMTLAERADLIVDFSNVPVGNYVLRNVGPDEPFNGSPIEPAAVADPQSTGQIMQFRVGKASGGDPTTPPQFMQLPAIAPLPAAVRTRKVALLEVMSMAWDGPAEAMLGRVDEDGFPVVMDGRMHAGDMWMDPVTENPNPGDTEIWEIYNFTADAHPMHVHEVTFEVVNREGLVVNLEGETEAPARLTGAVRGPEPWETGRKDMVIAYPGEVTRIKAQFLNPGTFVWHCHIVEHEDNEMMRPYRIGPVQDGQPAV
jgi:spore coat protein A, manganese oxidase